MREGAHPPTPPITSFPHRQLLSQKPSSPRAPPPPPPAPRASQKGPSPLPALTALAYWKEVRRGPRHTLSFLTAFFFFSFLLSSGFLLKLFKQGLSSIMSEPWAEAAPRGSCHEGGGGGRGRRQSCRQDLAGDGCEVSGLGSIRKPLGSSTGSPGGLQDTPEGFGVKRRWVHTGKNPPAGCFGGDGGKGEGLRERKRMGEAMLKHRRGPATACSSYLKSRPWETSSDVRFL